MPVYLGIDGGGSGTRAVAVDVAGSVIFQGEGGPSNLATLDGQSALRGVFDAVKGCPRPDFVCGCFAGVVDERTRERALEPLHKWLPHARLEVRPDYHAAVAAASEGTTSVVIAGTGSVVASLMRGEVVKTGGGGPLLGDQGSAFAVGRRMLQVGLLGVPLPSEVQAALQERLGSLDLGAAISAIYASPNPASIVAKLAPVVAEAAKAGNTEAGHCVNQEMSALAELAAMHVLRFHADVDSPRLTLAGGLWEASTLFMECFEERINNRELGGTGSRRFIMDRLSEAPVYGAVKLARRLDR